MQRSTDRIRTTHVGSLARPPALLDLMKAAAAGKRLDPEELAEAERQAVADVVAWQRAAGLDVVSDGEQSKPGFFAYTGERLLLRHQRGSPGARRRAGRHGGHAVHHRGRGVLVRGGQPATRAKFEALAEGARRATARLWNLGNGQKR
jgi:hypothetical protein